LSIECKRSLVFIGLFLELSYLKGYLKLEVTLEAS